MFFPRDAIRNVDSHY